MHLRSSFEKLEMNFQVTNLDKREISRDKCLGGVVSQLLKKYFPFSCFLLQKIRSKALNSIGDSYVYQEKLSLFLSGGCCYPASEPEPGSLPC